MCTYYVDMDGWMDGWKWQRVWGGSVTVLFCYDDDDGVMGNIWF